MICVADRGISENIPLKWRIFSRFGLKVIKMAYIFSIWSISANCATAHNKARHFERTQIRSKNEIFPLFFAQPSWSSCVYARMLAKISARPVNGVALPANATVQRLVARVFIVADARHMSPLSMRNVRDVGQTIGALAGGHAIRIVDVVDIMGATAAASRTPGLVPFLSLCVVEQFATFRASMLRTNWIAANAVRVRKLRLVDADRLLANAAALVSILFHVVVCTLCVYFVYLLDFVRSNGRFCACERCHFGSIA